MHTHKQATIDRRACTAHPPMLLQPQHAPPQQPHTAADPSTNSGTSSAAAPNAQRLSTLQGLHITSTSTAAALQQQRSSARTCATVRTTSRMMRAAARSL